MIEWFRTSRLSIKNSLSVHAAQGSGFRSCGFSHSVETGESSRAFGVLDIRWAVGVRNHQDFGDFGCPDSGGGRCVCERTETRTVLWARCTALKERCLPRQKSGVERLKKCPDSGGVFLTFGGERRETDGRRVGDRRETGERQAGDRRETGGR